MTTATFDLSFRPASYFGPQSLDEQITSRISGKARRQMVKDALSHGEAVPAVLLRSTLDEPTRKAFTASHPGLLGGEFLPEQPAEEVEIARISLESVTSDQVVVRVRRSGSRLRYRVDDEYDNEYVSRKYGPRSSTQPLTMGQLIKLIASAYSVYEVIDSNIDGGCDPAEMETFVTVTSDFYPDLQHYYACEIAAWLKEQYPPENDDENEATTTR